MSEWIVAILTAIGVAFSVLGGVGVFRLPDLYMRMQAATKSGTLGVGFLTIAAAVRFESLGDTTQSMLIVAFLILTMPVAAHIVGRAAYAAGVPMWRESVMDELQEHTDQQEQNAPSIDRTNSTTE